MKKSILQKCKLNILEFKENNKEISSNIYKKDNGSTKSNSETKFNPNYTPNFSYTCSAITPSNSYLFNTDIRNENQEESDMEETYNIVDEVVDKQNYGLMPQLWYSHPSLGSKIFQFNAAISEWEECILEEGYELPINSKTVYYPKAESIHFIGGYFMNPLHQKVSVDYHYQWGIGSKSLKKLKSMNLSRYCFGVWFLLDFIYVAGGASNEFLLKNCERYNIDSKWWEELPDTKNKGWGQILIPVDIRYIYSFLRTSMPNRSSIKVLGYFKINISSSQLILLINLFLKYIKNTHYKSQFWNRSTRY